MVRAEENRQRIVAAVAPLFNMRGFAGTSMSDVLEVTGLHKGSLYLCFPSKEELAVAVFDYSAGLMMRHVQEAMRGAPRGARDQLLAFVGVYASVGEQGPAPGGCPIMNAAIESDDAYPFLRERVVEALRHWQNVLREIVARGIESGEFAAATDADRVVAVLIGGIEGALMMTRVLGDPAPLRHMVEVLCAEIAAL